ncbi:SDR family NAD(P)-dependent oxidoreductase [Croceicoccus pelagius]|uniref:3-oxoacyl-ACP reductase n=1 Tax=Croceicoccus pelagius TaxID=1703341 RepID=A0A916Y6A6_9SPHN|nr:SDR family oxidoreductase [Croceicoccus pelagius]GGD33232.1 3-oxoacyl-ACP reductase [Croceicoccus pelagius]
MSDRLSGKVALVTGGTAGIGAGAVRRLAAEGAKVIFTGSREEAARPLCEETGATFFSHRVQDAQGWEELSAKIRKDFGRLDIAFANAGTEKNDGSVENITLEGWNFIVEVNQTGAMLTCQNAIRIMKDNPGGPTGSVIINSSMNAHRAMGNYMGYSVTKAAVVALAKSAANYCGLAGYKIRVNAILPGVVETDLILNIMNSQEDPAAARAMYEGMAPLKRMASVDEVASLVAFLGSDEAAFISGGEYTIDGATTAGMSGV